MALNDPQRLICRSTKLKQTQTNKAIHILSVSLFFCSLVYYSPSLPLFSHTHTYAHLLHFVWVLCKKKYWGESPWHCGKRTGQQHSKLFQTSVGLPRLFSYWYTWETNCLYYFHSCYIVLTQGLVWFIFMAYQQFWVILCQVHFYTHKQFCFKQFSLA